MEFGRARVDSPGDYPFRVDSDGNVTAASQVTTSGPYNAL
jgi:hypothetical protein